MQVSNLFVCLMGMGVTFIGLICLIFLTKLMGAILSKVGGKEEAAAKAAPAAKESIPNRGEMIAAVSAAVAEELGTDVSAIRIHSFRKIDQ